LLLFVILSSVEGLSDMELCSFALIGNNLLFTSKIIQDKVYSKLFDLAKRNLKGKLSDF